jgi:hypothetical protein
MMDMEEHKPISSPLNLFYWMLDADLTHRIVVRGSYAGQMGN